MLHSMMIPRVFHFIWLGPRDLPESQRRCVESWRRHHPGWEVRIWRDEDVPRLRNQEEFDRALSMAGKADVLRVEVLHDHGGVYLDTDMECLRPIDELLAGCDGFLARTHPSGRIGNTVFGAVPGHEFTRRLIDLVPRWFHPRQPHRTGPTLYTKVGKGCATMRVFEQTDLLPALDRRPARLRRPARVSRLLRGPLGRGELAARVPADAAALAASPAADRAAAARPLGSLNGGADAGYSASPHSPNPLSPSLPPGHRARGGSELSGRRPPSWPPPGPPHTRPPGRGTLRRRSS